MQPALRRFPLTGVKPRFSARRESADPGDAGESMRSRIVALAVALAGCHAAASLRAQDRGISADPTAEEMIEVAREVWAATAARRPCPAPTPGEIVVCAPGEEVPRVESPTQEAIRKDERPRDSIPRAPDVFGLPPCDAYAFCSKVGRTPTPPLLIDLEALPEPLTPEEAALVFRAEDLPADAATPEAASPAEAP